MGDKAEQKPSSKMLDLFWHCRKEYDFKAKSSAFSGGSLCKLIIPPEEDDFTTRPVY